MKAVSPKLEPLWISGAPSSLIEQISNLLTAPDNPAQGIQTMLNDRRAASAGHRADAAFSNDAPLTGPHADIATWPDLVRTGDEAAYVPCIVDGDLPGYFEALPAELAGYQLLFWESPVAALLRFAAADAGEGRGSLDDWLEAWRHDHEQLLAAYWASPDRALLVRADRLPEGFGTLIAEELAGLWGNALPPGLVTFLDKLSANPPSTGEGVRHLNDEVMLALVSDGYPECHDLYAEMESCCALLGRDAELGVQYPDAKTLAKSVLELQFGAVRAEAEARDTQARLDAAAQDRDHYQALASSSLSECEGVTSRLAASAQQLSESREEAELLLMQLHQVQEELEHVFAHKEESDKALEAVRSELAASRQDRDEQFRIAQERQAQVEAKHRELADSLQQREALHARAAALTAERNQLKASVQELQKEIAKTGKARDEQGKLAQERLQQMEAGKKQLADLTKERDQVKADIQKLQKEVAKIGKARDEQSSLAQERLQQLEAGKKQLAGVTQQHRMIEAHVTALTKERDQLKADLQKLQNELAQAGKARDEQSGLAQERLQQVEAKDKQLTELARLRDELKTELESTSRRLHETSEESELLLLQLHQVQEELEHYFLEHQQALQLLDAFQTSQERTRTLIAQVLRIRSPAVQEG